MAEFIIAPNLKSLSVDVAIQRGYIKVLSGGQSRTVSLTITGGSLHNLVCNAAIPSFMYPSIVTGNRISSPYTSTLTIPPEAVRWCITSSNSTAFYEVESAYFGGVDLSIQPFALVWYDGSTWHNENPATRQSSISGIHTRKTFYDFYADNDLEYGGYEFYFWGRGGAGAIWAPYVTDPAYGYWSGGLYTNMSYTISGAPFIRNMDNAVTYVTTGVNPEDEPVVDPSFGPESEPGGYTGYIAPTGGDNINVPTTPPSALGSGLLHLYKVDDGALQSLGRELFPRISWPSPGQDIIQWLGEVIEKLSDSIWNKDLIDYIISIHLVPCDLPRTSLEDIVVGPRVMSGILARPQSSEYVDVDFGTVNVSDVYNNFGDYLTNVRLFLPFYGFVPINVQDCMGGSIGVKYRFNIIDGSFMAYVSVTPSKSHKNASIIGQYGGSAVIHLPLTGSNYANMFSSMVGAGAGIATGMATGSISVAASSAIGLASSLGGGGGREGNNSYNASSAIMSRRKPFISVERVVSSFSSSYIDEKGVPSNITCRLGECKGFTKVVDPVVSGIAGATDKDIQELRRLLSEGVYF